MGADTPPGPEGDAVNSPAPDVGQRQGACTPSVTTMNGGQATCSGQLIFEDNFNDLDQWNNDIHMAGAPVSSSR